MARRTKRRRRLGQVDYRTASRARRDAESYCHGVYGSGFQDPKRVKACVVGVRTALQFVMRKG